MKFDDFISIWSKFLQSFNNARQDLEREQQQHQYTNSNTNPTPVAEKKINFSVVAPRTSADYSSRYTKANSHLASKTTSSGSLYHYHHHNHNHHHHHHTLIEMNNFDKLCTDVRTCNKLPNKNRFRIKSINDISMPNSRNISES